MPTHSANGRLTIDLEAIVANWKKLANKASHKNCAAVVKANGYGLGAVEVSHALFNAGCREFFVATVEEGVELRKAIKEATIYIFSGFNRKAAKTYKSKQLIPVINSLSGIADWQSYATASMKCALHVDTGMNRLGLSESDVSLLADDQEPYGKFNPSLIISHFACADDPGNPLNNQQIEAFSHAASLFPNARKSLANSAGIFIGKSAHFDMLRPGIALYGGEAVNTVNNPMKPVLKLEGRIIQIRQAKKGESVGYGACGKLERDSVIAVVGIGYADGLHRSTSGAGTPSRTYFSQPGIAGMIGKHKAPLIGRVSMDLTTYDVTDIPSKALADADWIELINNHITVDDVAASAGTIGYEILTSLGKRYERIYKNR